MYLGGLILPDIIPTADVSKREELTPLLFLGESIGGAIKAGTFENNGRGPYPIC